MNEQELQKFWLNCYNRRAELLRGHEHSLSVIQKKLDLDPGPMSPLWSLRDMQGTFVSEARQKLRHADKMLKLFGG